MSPGPFTSLFFTISIWIRLTISVSIKSREIKGRGTRPTWQDESISVLFGSINVAPQAATEISMAVFDSRRRI